MTTRCAGWGIGLGRGSRRRREISQRIFRPPARRPCRPKPCGGSSLFPPRDQAEVSLAKIVTCPAESRHSRRILADRADGPRHRLDRRTPRAFRRAICIVSSRDHRAGGHDPFTLGALASLRPTQDRIDRLASGPARPCPIVVSPGLQKRVRTQRSSAPEKGWNDLSHARRATAVTLVGVAAIAPIGNAMVHVVLLIPAIAEDAESLTPREAHVKRLSGK